MNILHELFKNGLLVYVACPDDATETRALAEHIERTGCAIGCVVTSSATLDQGATLLPRPLRLPELTWPDIECVEPFIAQTWSIEAAQAVSEVLEVMEMGPNAVAVVMCEHMRLASAVATSVLSMASPPEGWEVKAITLPHGGGFAFVL